MWTQTSKEIGPCEDKIGCAATDPGKLRNARRGKGREFASRAFLETAWQTLILACTKARAYISVVLNHPVWGPLL